MEMCPTMAACLRGELMACRGLVCIRAPFGEAVVWLMWPYRPVHMEALRWVQRWASYGTTRLYANVPAWHAWLTLSRFNCNPPPPHPSPHLISHSDSRPSPLRPRSYSVPRWHPWRLLACLPACPSACPPGWLHANAFSECYLSRYE